MMRTYHGGCHCGAVRFQVDLDLSAGTSRCNCSICSKGRFWKAIAVGDAFTLVQGEAALADYQFGRGVIHHRFCRTCGVKPFGHGSIPQLGDFHAINLGCLEDASDEELAAAPVAFENGRGDDWDQPPAVTSHL